MRYGLLPARQIGALQPKKVKFRPASLYIVFSSHTYVLATKIKILYNYSRTSPSPFWFFDSRLKIMRFAHDFEARCAWWVQARHRHVISALSCGGLSRRLNDAV